MIPSTLSKYDPLSTMLSVNDSYNVPNIIPQSFDDFAESLHLVE
jgi:hypothetical protein